MRASRSVVRVMDSHLRRVTLVDAPGIVTAGALVDDGQE